MKNFQVKLFVALALGLCGLCAWQWYFQTVQRGQMEEQSRTIYERDKAIQGYTNSIRTMDLHIAEMDRRITELKQTLMTNGEFIIVQKREVARLAASNDTLSAEIAQYTNAIAFLESKLKEAYDGIKKQNEAVEQLAAQRDEFVKKYNDSVKDRNDVVVKYNEVVDRLNKLQATLTNAPGK
jgi:chromosome segregation ATPase